MFLEYGSTLSCPSPESRVKMSLHDCRNDNDTDPTIITTNNDAIGRFSFTANESQNLYENVTLSRNSGITMDGVTDTDMYWEMNYHEAAIFLEVINLKNSIFFFFLILYTF